MKRLFFLFIGIIGAHYAKSQEQTLLILFDFNKTDIPDSSLVLLSKTMHQKVMDRVLIEGHCDSIGSLEYNRLLSYNRARAVYKLLTQNGMDKKQIKTCIGYGKEKPLNQNANEAERQLNRRVLVTFYWNENSTKDSPLKSTLQTNEKKEAAETLHPVTNIQVADVKVGNTIVMEHLLFEPGRHILKEDSKYELQEILQLLRDYPSLEVEIQGHVCCAAKEDDGYDWDTDMRNLSEARAKTIYDFLVHHGVSAKRLTHKGYGASRKIHEDEEEEASKRENRRVELKILKM